MFIFDYSIIAYNRHNEIISRTYESVYARNIEEVKEYVQSICRSDVGFYEVPGEITKGECVAIRL